MAATSTSSSDREIARLEALRRCAILDTPPESDVDALVRAAAREIGYPTVLLSFMDANRCWFKAATGVPPGGAHLHELPRHETFCNHALATSGILVVPDAREDARFSKLRIVDRPDGYRAYAGAQLITPEGHSIGTLCVLDTVPRTPTQAQKETLYAFAARAMTLIDARRRDLAPAPSAALAPPEAALAGGGRELVLIVDDDDLIRGMMSAMMARLGCDVRLAENGRAALECIAAEGGRVRIVCTDVHMPVMNGVELVEELRRQSNPPAVVVMSGKFTEEIRAQLMAAGVVTMFGKPFLMAEVARALDLARAAVR